MSSQPHSTLRVNRRLIRRSLSSLSPADKHLQCSALAWGAYEGAGPLSRSVSVPANATSNAHPLRIFRGKMQNHDPTSPAFTRNTFRSSTIASVSLSQ